MNVRYSMLPKSNPANDYYVFCDEQIDYEARLIGKVLNQDGSMYVEVWVSDEVISQTRHRNMFFEVNEKHYLTGCRIVMSSRFAQLIEEAPFLHAIIWHEIGHFHTLPYMLNDSKVEVPEIRKNAVLAGKVMPEEQVADLFAAYANGKEDMIKALRWLREDRKKLMPFDPSTELASKEFNNRIRLLKEIDEDKMLEKYYEVFEANRIR